MKKRKLPFGISREFVLYGFIGLSGALLDFILYLFFYHTLAIPPGIASFISVSFGILNNFILNSRFNFKIKDHPFFRFLSFYTIGVAGAVLSAIIIIVLFNGLGLSAAVAKLITIVPVVILQFFLNKRFSFNPNANISKSLTHLKQWFNEHKWFLVVIVIFCLFTTFFVKQLPLTAPNGGPDESVHYRYNVEFLLEHKRLPVSGVDDTEALSTCRDNPVGQVPCIYSYQVYPPVNYIITAIVALVVHSSIGLSYLTGARIASVLFGVVFLICIYAASRLITKNPRIAALITAAVGLIPQVVFIFSYVNQDAFSLMVSAMVLYTLTLVYYKRSIPSLLLAGITIGGLLAVTKYNYFILYVPVFMTLVLFIVRKVITKRHLHMFVLSLLLSAVFIAGIWYLRNQILYGDFTGQQFTLHAMQRYHELGVPLSITSIDTLKLFTSMNFFEALFYSFFASFGYMSLYLEVHYYALVLAAIVGSFVTFFAITSVQKPSTRNKATGILSVLILVLIGLVVMVYSNSALYDFQPQGRYLFPILPVLAISFALWYQQARQYRGLLFIMVGCIAFLYLPVVNLLIRSYL